MDLGLKRVCVGSALTIVPRAWKSDDTSYALYEISSAITRNSSARFSIVLLVIIASLLLVNPQAFYLWNSSCRSHIDFSRYATHP